MKAARRPSDVVPKDVLENVRYRRDMVLAAREDRLFQRLLWSLCSRDLLFYINTFCWLFEPRDARELPFVTYGFQDGALKEILDAVGHHDLVIEKSRDMGASWMCVTVLEWLWHFHGRQTFLLLSRKEELVDKRGDPKSLFWKIDFIHKFSPGWLVPPVDGMKMHRENIESGATLDGESTNEFAGVADRRRALLLDEYSKMDNQQTILRGTRDVTYSRIFNFTPQGAGDASYEIAHSPNFKKLTLHWSCHPLKSKGLYRPVGREVELLDKEYWTPERVAEYEFRYELPLNPRFDFRSPWYDGECDRTAHPMEIAQELDIDYMGSDFQFFHGEILNRLKETACRRAHHQGAFDYTRDLQQFEFVPRTKGPLHLWLHVDAVNEVPKDRAYCIGADISQGTGASSSVLSIGDTKTGEKVGRYKTNRMDPKEFGRLAVALAKYFNNAFLIWEANGPGRGFGDGVIEAGYRNIYYRKNEFSLSKKQQDTPGWYSTAENKMSVLTEYRRALASGEFINRSRDAMDECAAYIYAAGNKVEHSGALAKQDMSNTGASHGDEVIADALCWKGMRRPAHKAAPAAVVPKGCMMWRRLEHQRKQREKRETAMSW